MIQKQHFYRVSETKLFINKKMQHRFSSISQLGPYKHSFGPHTCNQTVNTMQKIISSNYNFFFKYLYSSWLDVVVRSGLCLTFDTSKKN